MAGPDKLWDRCSHSRDLFRIVPWERAMMQLAPIPHPGRASFLPQLFPGHGRQPRAATAAGEEGGVLVGHFLTVFK